MGIRCGIVGLPNVGKSTLFNALTASGAAQVGNFPFCTVDPNVGRVEVPDARLDAIAAIARPARVVHNRIELVDIAGLVRGASRGEGLGNRFLAHIREVDAAIHLVRCFEGAGIAHVDGAPDPLRDIETVETELLLADLESLERRAEAAARHARSGDGEARARLAAMEPVLAALGRGEPARSAAAKGAQSAAALQLLTARPTLYVCNVGEDEAAGGNAASAAVARHAARQGAEAVVVSAALEAELAALAEDEERTALLAAMGLAEPGLHRVARAAWRLLGLVTFFTAGPKEVRAWTVSAGATAPQAARQVHSDIERGFICAETVAFEDYVGHHGERGARQAGRLRQEGRDYRIADGDVVLFRFNV